MDLRAEPAVVQIRRILQAPLVSFLGVASNTPERRSIMGLFSKRNSSGLVPSDILNQLSAFGHVSFDATVRGQAVADPRYDWSNFFSRVLHAYQTNLMQAIAEIHAAAGGDPYAMYGGYRVIAEFEPATQDPLYLDMMDAGLKLMYDRKLSSGHLTGYEADRWVKTHGELRTSFDRIVDVMPPEHDTASVELATGESVMVAKMGPDPLDNQFYIERIGPNTFGAFSMRQWDSDAVTLTRSEETTIPQSDTAEGVLRSLGLYLRLRPYWAHDQLQPFFPERRDI
jgi:hypothetical protein